MKRNVLTIGVFVAIMLAACANPKKVASTPEPPTPPEAPAPAKSTVMAPIEYLRMERSACFGKCPVYNVEVYKNGLVRYSSVMFTEKEGVYEKNIGTAKVNSLFKRFTDYHVDTCQDKYEAYIQDLPGLAFSFKYGGKEKTIRNAHFGPGFFKQLGMEVDSIAKPDFSWKRVSDKNVTN